MLSKALLLVLSVYGAQSMKDVDDRLMTKIHNFQLCSACWGEDFAIEYSNSIYAATDKCMGKDAAVPLPASIVSYPATLLRGVMPMYPVNGAIPSYYQPMAVNTLGRKKRNAAADFSVGPADAYEFMDAMEDKVGNFTCVMKELGMLTASGEINTEVFSHSEELGMSGGVFASGDRAGADPVFLKKLTSGMSDCYALSRSFPQQALNKNPFMQRYGRMAVYFMCIKKVERQCCAKYVLNRILEKSGVTVDLPLAADKYDAAAMGVKIMEHGATEEEKHIDDYFWGDMDM